MVSATLQPVESEKAWKKRHAAHMRHWREAVAFYERNKPRLVRNAKYRNQHIAIRDKRVVDVDRDRRALLARLRERFPDERFLIHQVLKVDPVINVGDFVVEP